MNSKTIVITGCSSGFGRVTALTLAHQGWYVFATVRNEEDRASLLSEAAAQNSAENLTPVLCDITRAEQVTALASTVAQATQQLDALLNNAGAVFAGPLEVQPLDDIRAQMEVNVIAHVGVIQALLPLLKAAKGTIINVSSAGGRISTPIIGAYSASKFAMEAISDALRLEMAPFGVRVVVIEPGGSPTSIWQTSMQISAPYLEQHRNGPYTRLLNLFEKIAMQASKRGFPPQLFANTIIKILTSRNPRTRYAIPFSTALSIFLRKILPDKLWDWLLRRALRW